LNVRCGAQCAFGFAGGDRGPLSRLKHQSRAPAHHLNHIPVVGIPIGAALLIYGLMRGSEEVKRVSVLVFVVLAIITVPTYLAGQAAEDMVEHLPGVDDDFIHTHEDAATIGLIVTSILRAISQSVLGCHFSAGVFFSRSVS
jgi:hypothetical protein